MIAERKETSVALPTNSIQGESVNLGHEQNVVAGDQTKIQTQFVFNIGQEAKSKGEIAKIDEFKAWIHVQNFCNNLKVRMQI